MPKREPGHQNSGQPLGNVVKLRQDPSGRWVLAPPEAPETTAETEAAERPPVGEDPRPAAFRNIPPFGGAV